MYIKDMKIVPDDHPPAHNYNRAVKVWIRYWTMRYRLVTVIILHDTVLIV